MTSETKAAADRGWAGLRAAMRSRGLRRGAIGVVVFLVVFGLLGFFAAPPLIRHLAERQLSAALDRPTTIGHIGLDPYTLRLEADRVRVAERGGGEFARIERLVVRLSWLSVLRFAPIVAQVRVDSPYVSVVRYDAQRFNFTDLIEKFAKPSQPQAHPVMFSVSNIDVENGRIDFDDKLLGVRHVIDRLALGVPFIATLPATADIFVDPRFSARIDGSPLSIGGKTKPFSTSRESQVALKFDALDLPRLLSYVPAKLPVAMQTGKLGGDLQLNFEFKGDKPSLRIEGTADLTDARFVDERQQPLFAARGVHVAANGLEPLAGVFHFDQIRLDQPSVYAAREHSGELSIARTFAASPAQGTETASAASAASTGAAAAQRDAAPLDVSVKHLAIDDGKLVLEDRVPAAPAAVTLQQLNVTLDDFSTLSKAPARYTVQTGFAQGGSLGVKGTVALAGKTADAKFDAQRLPLSLAAPYLADAVAARVTGGTVGTTLAVHADWSKTPIEVMASDGEVSVDALKIAAPGAATPSLALAQGRVLVKRVDLAARTADVTSVDVSGLAVTAVRQKNGQIDLAALAQAPGRAARSGGAAGGAGAAGTHGRAPTRAAAAPAEPGWHYTLGELTVKDSTADFTDDSPARPAAFHVAQLALNARNVSDDFSRALPVTLNGTLNGKGALRVTGNVTPSPLSATLAIDADRLDAAAAEPYFGDKLNAAVASALLSARGDLSLRTAKSGALEAAYRGGASLTDVRLLDRLNSAPLAGWRSLALTGVTARYDEHGTNIDVGRVNFERFFGRVLLDAQGKLNLADVLTQQKAASEPAPAGHGGSRTAPVGASAAAGASAPATAVASVGAAPASATSAASAATGSTRAAGQPAVHARVGQVVLQAGRLNYTDNFVKPNYTANLVDITGTIGSFGTDNATPAPVDVGASLAANGPIAIRGTVNPLASKPSLDLNASAHDIELTNLSPYSMKYAGYPITKGKLNVDVHYKLENDALTANNHIFINQLTFGDRVENDTATKLPVKLAIALLKNSRGEIDVNIPVSGSLSNPEFSLGGLIWRAVVHLIEKAVTAPFSLLANALGGSGPGAAEQLRYLAFAPGSDTLDASAHEKLDTLAKLLTDKPEVKLDLGGRVDPAIDTPALRLAHVDRLVRQEKIKALIGRGESIDPASVTVTPAEYSSYLAKLYKSAKFDKPRNFIGMTKSVPDDEMKRALAEHTTIDDADLRALAQGRAEAARQYLIEKIDPSRLFVVAPKLDAKGVSDGGPSTRVDFTLE
jgi:hypothetical protein